MYEEKFKKIFNSIAGSTSGIAHNAGKALAQNARKDNPEIEIYCVGDDRWWRREYTGIIQSRTKW